MTSLHSAPCFFKIIIHRNLEDKKLMIPTKFVEEYGKFLSSSILLKLPDGLEWKVGLTTSSNGRVWLQNGWLQFSTHYDLKFGSLLVFRFHGNSTFHTIIFNTSGLEIQYHSNHTRNEVKFSPKIEPEEEEYTNPSREMPNRRMKERVSKRSRQPFCPSPAKEVEADHENFINSDSAEKICFRVVMGKSSVEGRFNMTIPKEFAKNYLNKDFGCIQVQNLAGRTWPLVYKWSQSHKVDYAYISTGWKKFAEENYLKEGEIGLFAMIKKDHFLFSLVEDQEQYSSPPISPKKHTSSACTSSSTKNPSFEVEIHQQCYKSSVQNIPVTFADNHFSETTKSAKFVVGKKQWKVKIKQYGRCIRFSNGWSRFYCQNGLEDGDFVLFELLNKTESKCVFKVHIFKKRPSTSSSSD